MMQSWADYLDGLRNGAKIIPRSGSDSGLCFVVQSRIINADNRQRGLIMTTLEIDNETTAMLSEMADQEHIGIAELANRLLAEALEDWHDARAADKALAELERGESGLLSWDEVKAGLYDMDN